MVKLLTSTGDTVQARTVESAARKAYGPDAHPTAATRGWAVYSYVTAEFLGDLWPLEESR